MPRQLDETTLSKRSDIAKLLNHITTGQNMWLGHPRNLQICTVYGTVAVMKAKLSKLRAQFPLLWMSKGISIQETATAPGQCRIYADIEASLLTCLAYYAPVNEFPQAIVSLLMNRDSNTENWLTAFISQNQPDASIHSSNTFSNISFDEDAQQYVCHFMPSHIRSVTEPRSIEIRLEQATFELFMYEKINGFAIAAFPNFIARLDVNEIKTPAELTAILSILPINDNQLATHFKLATRFILLGDRPGYSDHLAALQKFVKPDHPLHAKINAAYAVSLYETEATSETQAARKERLETVYALLCYSKPEDLEPRQAYIANRVLSLLQHPQLEFSSTTSSPLHAGAAETVIELSSLRRNDQAQLITARAQIALLERQLQNLSGRTATTDSVAHDSPMYARHRC